jgi:uncharacterized RDD family membrane protein YckC
MSMSNDSNPQRPASEPAHLGWRVVALVYDSLPVIALWFVFSALVLVLRGGAPVVPWTWAFWLQALGLWGLTGLYAVGSWRRGGQTLGMRPWRLKVVGDDGGSVALPALWGRYAWASVSLFAAGLGFLWSLFDGERRALHDRLSGTRLVRLSPAR